MNDIDILKELLLDEANLDYVEVETGSENTWYIDVSNKQQPEFNFITTEYNIIVNINSKSKYNELFGDVFIGRLLLKGFNLKNSTYIDNNNHGDLNITSFRRMKS